MGLRIAIVGEPTKGKSTGIFPNETLKIKGLDPKETILLSFSGKQLPVRGANTMYPKDKKLSEGGNHAVITDVKTVPDIIKNISDKRPEIKHVVLEDCQYSMANEFMARAKESGYNKFTDIGVNFSNWMNAVKNSREDLKVWIIWHPEKSNDGSFKMKTVGTMIDNYLTMEGLMDMIFYADCEKGSDSKMDYFFVTNNDGKFPARTPSGMFEKLHVPNDLGYISTTIDNYYN